MVVSLKRRWYQFSLRTLLIVVTLAATGCAWWKHRCFCLEQFRIHADRNAACAFKVNGIGKDENLTTREGLVTWGYGGSGEDHSNYSLWVSPTERGYRRWRLELGGKPPIRDQQIQADMDQEAELADRYLHAIWRPWERLWIEERPAPAPRTTAAWEEAEPQADRGQR